MSILEMPLPEVHWDGAEGTGSSVDDESREEGAGLSADGDGNSQEAEWHVGHSIPSLGRGRHASLNRVGLQLIGNVEANLSKLSPELLHQVGCVLAGRQIRKGIEVGYVLSMLCGVARGTMSHWRNKVEAMRQETCSKKRARSLGQAAGRMRNESMSANGNLELGAAFSQLPIIIESAAEDSRAESDSDIDIFEDELVDQAHGSLDTWKSHSEYAIGIRVAELATMWYVNGWSQLMFPEFLAWAKTRLPQSPFGSLNHSKRFIHDFLPSLTYATQVGTAASLHAVLPALGIPSLLSRVIDIVSVNGQSLLPIIHIYTNSQGMISWLLLGCPCMEASKLADTKQVANGTEQIFGFHKANRMVGVVHALETRYHIGRDDRAARLALTVADQAIQGPGSIHFTQEECRQDGLAFDPLSEAICKFHIADGIGDAVDKLYEETQIYDRLLRLIRRHFAFGTGKLILRACAQKFESMAQEFDMRAANYREQVARLEANCQLIAAERARANAARADAEASALRRSGWTKAYTPTAPKMDGTRKVVWQTRSRELFLKMFGLIFWGIQARMIQTLENCRQALLKQGQTISINTGLRTQEMRSWRSLGRAMLDVRILVFNLGRADFRRRHLRAYAMEIQASLTTSSMEAAVDMADSMLAAVGALVEIRGILKFIQNLCSGYELRCKSDGKWIITNAYALKPGNVVVPKAYSLWLTCKTLLLHRCWRQFPRLVLKLTEIALGGSFCGVDLHSPVFDEPLERGDVRPAEPKSREELQARSSAKRNSRFERVLDAISQLMAWAKHERHVFMTRVLGVPPRAPRKAAVVQCSDLPHIPEASQWQLEKDAEEDGDATPYEFRCSLAYISSRASGKPAHGGMDMSATTAYMADLLSENPSAPSKTMQSAAMFLAEACENISRSNRVVELHEISLTSVVHDAAQTALASTDIESDADLDDDDDDDDDGDDVEGDNAGESDVANQQTLVAVASSSSPIGGDTHTESGSRWRWESKASLPKVIGNLTLEEFHRAPRHNWIIGKNSSTQKWTFATMASYRSAARRRLLSKAETRAAFLLQSEMLFGRSLITGGNAEVIQHSLELLRRKCVGRFWQLSAHGDRNSHWHKAMPKLDPPHEMLEDISVAALALQYTRLRSWMECVAKQHGWHDFFTLEHVVVQRKDGQGCSFHVSVKDLRESSKWPSKYIPAVGSIVHSVNHGACTVLAVKKKPDMTRFYQHVMSSSLHEIRCRQVWHIVFAWHLYVHLSTASESLAESVGSLLQYIRSRHNRGGVGTKRIAWTSQLKAAGLKGTGGEDGIMAMGLNFHFKCHGPEGWHFSHRKNSADGETRTLTQLRAEARLWNQPAWVSSYINDVVKSRVIRLCKHLPRVDSFILSKEERKEDLSAQRKRQRIHEHSSAAYEPQNLSATLWKHLRITTFSLSKHVRPGRTPR